MGPCQMPHEVHLENIYCSVFINLLSNSSEYSITLVRQECPHTRSCWLPDQSPPFQINPSTVLRIFSSNPRTSDVRLTSLSNRTNDLCNISIMSCQHQLCFKMNSDIIVLFPRLYKSGSDGFLESVTWWVISECSLPHARDSHAARLNL